MFFGRDKYEAFQDTTPYKHVLARMLRTAMIGNQADTLLGSFAEDAMRLLKIELSFRRENFEEINRQLSKILETLHPENALPYVPENEPVFLVRSADPLGTTVVQEWINLATRTGVSGDRVKSATDQLERMRAYHEDTRPVDLDF
jgi:hypothetical protein